MSLSHAQRQRYAAGKRYCQVAAIASLVIGLCHGCAAKEVAVKGKVTKGGAPLPVAKGESLNVSLIPLEGEKATLGDLFYAETNSADGTFIVPGIRRRGITPGKYRIDVQVMPDRGTDRLEGKFSGPKSPIVRHISGSEELVIDLDNP